MIRFILFFILLAFPANAITVSSCSFTNPSADRLFFWDNSTGDCGIATPGGSLTIVGTEIRDSDPFCAAVTNQTSVITTGGAKITFRMPSAFTLTSVRANVKTASSSGILTFDINEGGASILSTLITIDVNEKTSVTADIPPVISDASLADDAEMTVDIDTAGTNAVGVNVCFIGRQN